MKLLKGQILSNEADHSFRCGYTTPLPVVVAYKICLNSPSWWAWEHKKERREQGTTEHVIWHWSTFLPSQSVIQNLVMCNKNLRSRIRSGEEFDFPCFPFALEDQHVLRALSWEDKITKRSKCYLSGRPVLQVAWGMARAQPNLCCPCGMTGMFLSTHHALCMAKCWLATYSFLFLQVNQVH